MVFAGGKVGNKILEIVENQDERDTLPVLGGRGRSVVTDVLGLRAVFFSESSLQLSKHYCWLIYIKAASRLSALTITLVIQV